MKGVPVPHLCIPQCVDDCEGWFVAMLDMAQPLRVEIAGGWYHVTARGNERRRIFCDDQDRKYFMELLAKLPEQLGLRVHACALMENHYHLMVSTPRGNLSMAVKRFKLKPSENKLLASAARTAESELLKITKR